jgi:hypothetical protein
MLFRKLCRFIALPLAVLMFLISAPLTMVANAALVTTDSVIGSLSAQQDRDKVLNFFSRDDVSSQFRSLGLAPDEARARVQAMSDEEVRQIAGRLDQIPAGQDGLGLVVFLIILALLVFAVTDLAGWTDVYPFINPVKK